MVFVEHQKFLVNRKPNKYHPYTRKYPATDVMGICPICDKKVYRGDGFIMEEFFEPTMHKKYYHHSKWDKCFETQCINERAEKEKSRKQKLGLPENPLDHLLNLKK